MAPGDAGHRMLKEAQDAYNAKSDSNPKASGVILHRKDQMVVDGTFKWIPCTWKFVDGQNLVLTPSPGGNAAEQEADSFTVNANTQYKKPKSKRYPLQFGSSTVYTSVLLETVVYEPTGYAPSAIDPLARPGTKAVQAMCKVASLEMEQLQKFLLCVQAVVEGKQPDAYL